MLNRFNTCGEVKQKKSNDSVVRLNRVVFCNKFRKTFLYGGLMPRYGGFMRVFCNPAVMQLLFNE